MWAAFFMPRMKNMQTGRNEVWLNMQVSLVRGPDMRQKPSTRQCTAFNSTQA
jgi:hypothetical protein